VLVASGVQHCPHCGTAVEAGPELGIPDPEGDLYCCSGCRLAAELIQGAGAAERYYARRTEFAPRPGADPDDGVRWDNVDPERLPDGRCRIRLQVDGLRCASCVWVTEQVLARQPGVDRAEVSYASGAALLEWQPGSATLTQLVGQISALGYRPRLRGETAAPDNDLLLRLGVATFAAMNLMLASTALYAGWAGGMAPRFVALFEWTSLLLATPVALWCAAPFYRGAWTGLRNGVLHMDLPIAIAVMVLFLHGAATTLFGVGEPYFDSLGMLVALLLAGRVLESRGRHRAADAAGMLGSVLPSTARRVRPDGHADTVAASALRPGDRILVGVGQELAADGIVDEGAALLRTAMLTGESTPESVAVGSSVWAGSLVESGALTVRVTAAAGATVLDRMAEELRDATDRGPRTDAPDRLAPWFTGVTLLVAALTALVWASRSGWDAALAPTIAVLVVACPCALALARPLAAAAGLGAAARRGLFLRSADALLDLAEVDLVALDKTGTVTVGQPEVLEARDETLRVASALERHSGHPIARAIVDEAVRRGIPLPTAERVDEVPGKGVTGVVDGTPWQIEAGEPGQVQLAGPGAAAGTIRLGDTMRSDSRAVVEELVALGVEAVLLTGDHPEVARQIAADAGLTVAGARMAPTEKSSWLRDRAARGRVTLFAGDGVNDGPALAEARVGVAMGSGAASSVLAADGVVARPSVRPLVAGIRAGRAAAAAVRGNRIRSVAYNIGAVAAAALGWVNPLVAAILMPLSSLLVVAGALGVERAVGRAEGSAAPLDAEVLS